MFGVEVGVGGVMLVWGVMFWGVSCLGVSCLGLEWGLRLGLRVAIDAS